MAAAEEAVAKARVADPALAAPWALAALIKLFSWERGLAGKGALEEAWEDALLALKSHAPVSSSCHWVFPLSGLSLSLREEPVHVLDTRPSPFLSWVRKGEVMPLL